MLRGRNREAVARCSFLSAIHYVLKWPNRPGVWPYVVYSLGLALVIYLLLLK